MNNNKTKFSIAIQTDKYQNLIKNTLGDPERAKRFVASISSAVAINNELQECTANTILSGALLGEALNLSPSPQLGHYYLVPFKKKNYNHETKTYEVVETNATFILGYKGYIQLAVRSGQYRDLDVIEIKNGEFKGRNSLTGKLEFSFIQNEVERKDKETIGYLAYFELLNGFQKKLFMTKEEMIDYADKYSSAFNKKGFELLMAGKISEKDMYKYSSFWYKDFDEMAKKTMLRRLISKWGIMSIEMQQAIEKDDTISNIDGTYYYPEPIDDSKVIEGKIEENNNNVEPQVKSVNIDEI